MGNKGLDSALKDTAFNEDSMLAFEAFDSYISAQPDYLPFITTTGVLFLEADYIAQPYLHDHSFCLDGLAFYLEVLIDR